MAFLAIPWLCGPGRGVLSSEAGMYRTIDDRFWRDPVVRSLSAHARYLFLYLISSPHAHLSGIYYLPRVVIPPETGLKPTQVSTAFEALSAAGRVRYDAATETVWVRHMFRWQGRGIKHVASAANHLASLQPSKIVNAFLQLYPTVRKHGETKGLAYPIDGVSAVGSVGTQDQEQEQEQEQENPPTPLRGSGHPSGDRQVWMDRFDEFWKPYPRKVGKADARKAFRAVGRLAVNGTTHHDLIENMLTMLEQRINGTWSKRDQETIPYPASFIRAEDFTNAAMREELGL